MDAIRTNNPNRAAWLGALLGLFALTVLLPGPAWGQGRVEAQLRSTDRVLEEARVIVAEALGDRPLRLLQSAVDLQRDAWGAFHEGRFGEAGVRTAAARKGAIRAIELAKAQRRLLDRVRQLQVENEDLIHRAREAVATSGRVDVARLFEAGKTELERGRRAFDQQDFRPAVRHSLLGRDLLLRAIRVAEGNVGTSRDRVMEDVRRTDEFLREARGSMEDRPTASSRLAEADRLQREARSALADGKAPLARQLTLRARELALEALRDDSAAPSHDDVQAFLERVTLRLADVRSEASGVDDAELTRLLSQAQAHLDRGRALLSEGEGRSALKEAQLASAVLARAIDRLR